MLVINNINENDCVIIRIPKGLASKIDRLAVHKLQEYNTVTEFVLEATRSKLKDIEIKSK
jgi:hypothetical protein